MVWYPASRIGQYDIFELSVIYALASKWESVQIIRSNITEYILMLGGDGILYKKSLFLA